MTSDTAWLQLLWLASPALPVGAFSYSEGLESAVETGAVHDEASAGRWLVDQLHVVQARADLAAVAAALVAWQAGDAARAEAVNQWVHQTRETAEQRVQTEQAGRSMAEWLRQRDVDATAAARACANLTTTTDAGAADPRVAALRAFAPAPTWPVAVALAAARTDAEPRAALLAIAFGWAENMVQAAVKAVPLGQAAGQRLLAALAADIPSAVDAALSLDDTTRQAFAPMLAILGAQHETQYSRLFRS